MWGKKEHSKGQGKVDKGARAWAVYAAKQVTPLPRTAQARASLEATLRLTL